MRSSRAAASWLGMPDAALLAALPATSDNFRTLGARLELTSAERVKLNSQVFMLTDFLQERLHVARFYVSGSYGRRVTVTRPPQIDLVIFLRKGQKQPPYNSCEEDLLPRVHAALAAGFAHSPDVHVAALMDPGCRLPSRAGHGYCGVLRAKTTGLALRNGCGGGSLRTTHRCAAHFVRLATGLVEFRIFIAPSVGRDSEEQRQVTYKIMDVVYNSAGGGVAGLRALEPWHPALLERPSEAIAHAPPAVQAFIRACQLWVRVQKIDSFDRYAVEALAYNIARSLGAAPLPVPGGGGGAGGGGAGGSGAVDGGFGAGFGSGGFGGSKTSSATRRLTTSLQPTTTGGSDASVSNFLGGGSGGGVGASGINGRRSEAHFRGGKEFSAGGGSASGSRHRTYAAATELSESGVVGAANFDLFAAFQDFLLCCQNLVRVNRMFEIESPVAYTSPWLYADVPVLTDRFNPYRNLLDGLTPHDRHVLSVAASEKLRFIRQQGCRAPGARATLRDIFHQSAHVADLRRRRGAQKWFSFFPALVALFSVLCAVMLLMRWPPFYAAVVRGTRLDRFVKTVQYHHHTQSAQAALQESIAVWGQRVPSFAETTARAFVDLFPSNYRRYTLENASSFAAKGLSAAASVKRTATHMFHDGRGLCTRLWDRGAPPAAATARTAAKNIAGTVSGFIAGATGRLTSYLTSNSGLVQ